MPKKKNVSNKLEEYVVSKKTKRKSKLYRTIKGKKVLNPRVLKKLKKKQGEIDLPTGYAYDYKNHKVMKVFQGKTRKLTKEFKGANKSNLKMYGNLAYNTTTKRVIKKSSIIGKKNTLKQKYKKKGLKLVGDKLIKPKKKKKLGKKQKKKNIKKLQKKIINFKQKKQMSFDIDLSDTGRLNAFDTIIDMLAGEQVVISMGLGGDELFYTLNPYNLQKIRQLLAMGGKIIHKPPNISESDMELIAKLMELDYLTIHRVVDGKALKDGTPKKKNSGGFFKYLCSTALNLKKYGILDETDDDVIPKDFYLINCLTRALQEGGLSVVKQNRLRTMVLNRQIPMCKLGVVATKLNIRIGVKKLGGTHKNIRWYGEEQPKQKSKKLDEYKIGLIDDHYFLMDNTEYTSYFIKNYEEIEKEVGWRDVFDYKYAYKKVGNKYKFDKNRTMNSFNLIKLLMEMKDTHLTPIGFSHNIMDTQFYDKIKSFDTLEYDDTDYEETILKPLSKKAEEEIASYDVAFFDFETYTDTKTNKHIPYLVCLRPLNNDITYTFYGKDCGKKMLKSLKKDTQLIAHNCGYDYRFLFKYLFGIKAITKGSSLMSGDAKIINNDGDTIKIKLKCSLKLISMPLRSFGKCFNLETTKEVMPYDLYDENTIDERFVSIKKALTYLKEEDHKSFIENIKRWELSYDDLETYDIIEYSRKYCEIDCDVLMKGFITFNEWINQMTFNPNGVFTSLDTYNTISIASLSHKYLINEGCYEEVNKFSGIPRHYIQNCIVGGRTMCNDNKKWKSKLGDKYSDFDAVSLYPSAMYRMGGFLKGTPKILTNKKYSFLEKQDGYYIRIKVLGIKKRRQFALLSYVNENGVRMFDNDKIIGKTIYIDRFGLEDAIRFQGLTFEIIDGYYFNEGRNNKIKEVISNMFSERLQKKKEKNPIQLVYKLMMNASYGKSMLKPIETDTMILDTEKQFKNILATHYNLIKEVINVKECGKYIVKFIKPIDEHFNNITCGVEILSMSKRIMNEVMCLAEDLGFHIKYQDTDSIHIKQNEIDDLAKAYKKMYNRDLIGKNMGQFHTDFDLKDENGDECENIYAEKSIFLGKKCYLDCLVGTNKEGKTIRGHHIRMKGIPSATIKYTAKKLGLTIEELYEKLYNEEKISFDLTNGGNRKCFDFCKNMEVKMNHNFKRQLQFLSLRGEE